MTEKRKSEEKRLSQAEKRVSFARKPSIMYFEMGESSPITTNDNINHQDIAYRNIPDENTNNNQNEPDYNYSTNNTEKYENVMEITREFATKDLTNIVMENMESYESNLHTKTEEFNLNDIKIENILNEVESSILIENPSSQKKYEEEKPVGTNHDSYGPSAHHLDIKQSLDSPLVFSQEVPNSQELLTHFSHSQKNENLQQKESYKITADQHGANDGTDAQKYQNTSYEKTTTDIQRITNIRDNEKNSKINEITGIEQTITDRGIGEQEIYDKVIREQATTDISIKKQHAIMNRGADHNFRLEGKGGRLSTNGNNLTGKMTQPIPDIRNFDEIKNKVHLEKHSDISHFRNAPGISNAIHHPNIDHLEMKDNVLKTSHNFTAMKTKEHKLDDNNTTTALMNTVDLEKYLKNSGQELPRLKTLNEKLEEIGVRFLDDLISRSSRKSTISAKQSDIPVEHQYYYKYYVEERIEFFCSFLKFLDSKMIEHSKTLINLEKEMVNIQFTPLSIKSKKQECRSKVKITWHELRKTREQSFNNIVEKNLNEMVMENKQLKSDLQAKIKEKTRVDMEIQQLVLKLNKLNRNSNKTDSCRVNKENCFNKSCNTTCATHCNDLIHIEKKISEQNSLIAHLKNEIKDKQIKIFSEKQLADQNLRESTQLEHQIRQLEEKLRIKTVDEQQCENIKKRFYLYCTFYQLKFKKITPSSILYSFLYFNIRYSNNSYHITSNKKNELITHFCNTLNNSLSQSNKQHKYNYISDYIIGFISRLAFLYEEVCHIEKLNFVEIIIKDEPHIQIHMNIVEFNNDQRVVFFVDDQLRIGKKPDQMKHGSLIEMAIL